MPLHDPEGIIVVPRSRAREPFPEEVDLEAILDELIPLLERVSQTARRARYFLMALKAHDQAAGWRRLAERIPR